jgi:hypothetical protein
MADHLGKSTLDARFVGDVGKDRERLATLRHDFVGTLPRCSFVTIGDGKLGARGGEQFGGGPPNAAGASGHDRHLTF